MLWLMNNKASSLSKDLLLVLLETQSTILAHSWRTASLLFPSAPNGTREAVSPVVDEPSWNLDISNI